MIIYGCIRKKINKDEIRDMSINKTKKILN